MVIVVLNKLIGSLIFNRFSKIIIAFLIYEAISLLCGCLIVIVCNIMGFYISVYLS